MCLLMWSNNDTIKFCSKKIWYMYLLSYFLYDEILTSVVKYMSLIINGNENYPLKWNIPF